MVAGSTSTPGSRHRAAAAGAVPRQAANHRARPAEATRVSAPSRALGRPLRSPHTLYPTPTSFPTAAYTAIVTHAAAATAPAGDAWSRGRARTARATSAASFVYLRDVRTASSGRRPTSPTCGEAEEYLVTFMPSAPSSAPGRRDRDRSSEIAVSPEDDVEVAAARPHQPQRPAREIEVRATPSRSSPSPADDLAIPPSASCSWRRVSSPIAAALLCRRGAGGGGTGPVCGARAEHGRANAGAVEWKATGRGSSAGGRSTEDPIALDAARCPAPSARCWIRSSACASACACPGRLRAHVVRDRRRSDREAALCWPEVHDPGSAARPFALAYTQCTGSSCGTWRSPATRRTCSAARLPGAPCRRLAPGRSRDARATRWRAGLPARVSGSPGARRRHGAPGGEPLEQVRLVAGDRQVPQLDCACV